MSGTSAWIIDLSNRPVRPVQDSVRPDQAEVRVIATRKQACRAEMSSSSLRKMMSAGDLNETKNFTSTSAVVSTIQRLIDIIGVIPLPAPMNSIFDVGQPKQLNFPAGPLMVSRSPSMTWSHSQFDTRPPGTRFTVNSRTCGRDGLD